MISPNAACTFYGFVKNNNNKPLNVGAIFWVWETKVVSLKIAKNDLLGICCSMYCGNKKGGSSFIDSSHVNHFWGASLHTRNIPNQTFRISNCKLKRHNTVQCHSKTIFFNCTAQTVHTDILSNYFCPVGKWSTVYLYRMHTRTSVSFVRKIEYKTNSLTLSYLGACCVCWTILKFEKVFFSEQLPQLL